MNQTVSPNEISDEQYQNHRPDDNARQCEWPLPVNYSGVREDKNNKQSQHSPDEMQLSSLWSRGAGVMNKFRALSSRSLVSSSEEEEDDIVVPNGCPFEEDSDEESKNIKRSDSVTHSSDIARSDGDNVKVKLLGI